MKKAKKKLIELAVKKAVKDFNVARALEETQKGEKRGLLERGFD